MSDFYNKYPYTDFHELNLDWVIGRVKKLTEDWLATQAEWNDTKEQWQQLYDYVHDYFANLDVQDEINNKINQMILDGTFMTIVTPTINQTVTDATTTWLAAHITQPTTPAIDNTLSIAGAAADSKAVGDMFGIFKDVLSYSYPENDPRLASYTEIYKVPFSFTSLQGGTPHFTDLPTGVNNCVIVHNSYMGYGGAYYYDLAIPWSPSGLAGHVFVRLSSDNGPVYSWTDIGSDTAALANLQKRVPYTYGEYATELSGISNIYQIPFTCISQISINHPYSDAPTGVTAGAFLHLAYNGTTNSGYYIDLVFPYAPTSERKKLYFRVSQYNVGEYFTWINLAYDSDAVANAIDLLRVLVPYSYGEGDSRLSSYSEIYNIPFSCITHHSISKAYTDVPTGVVGASVLHMPYNGNTTNGYYMDILLPYSPASETKKLYFRISQIGVGPYFAWREIRTQDLSHNTYVAFGDSITRGYTGLGTASKPYPVSIGNALNLKMTNEGVDGTGWYVDNNNTGSTGYDKLMAYDLTGVDLITIAFGINDYIIGTQSLADIRTKIEDVIDHISSTYPMTAMIFITPILYAGRGSSSTDFAFGQAGNAGWTLQEYTDMVVDVCQDNHIPVIDQSKSCFVNKFNYSSLLTDNLHPTDNGYYKLGCILSGEVGAYYNASVD